MSKRLIGFEGVCINANSASCAQVAFCFGGVSIAANSASCAQVAFYLKELVLLLTVFHVHRLLSCF